MGLSLDNWPDWAGWMVFEALFASIFVLEIVVKCVAARLNYFGCILLIPAHQMQKLIALQLYVSIRKTALADPLPAAPGA